MQLVPASPSEFSISADLIFVENAIQFSMVVQGPVDQLEMFQRPAVRTDELWKETCFEFFVAPKNNPAYIEFNGSPFGAWAAYHFDSERNGMKAVECGEGTTPTLRFSRRDQKSFQVEWQWKLPDTGLVGAFFSSGNFDIQLSAVLKTQGNSDPEYFALTHRKSTPDFHDRLSWIHEIRN